eukprot:CAMPEP_0175866112 /NCGR_PEP_ID=MMETSP0107_2-20121207/34033_1 /TAXON_ID=195067 ORGANISM="Goniomonas pacifica, Strain CCMP1869" /NCGR_SAMPLE_ID=MMETSP0107_2 /ASSEMBLY_ACC=CAM_ASM_000203 /LENGTH=56 /DNA_ID=CAMNT_0017183613 /DNA_START=15 /DNA_END=185 /DNA_ORIENTATION=+
MKTSLLGGLCATVSDDITLNMLRAAMHRDPTNLQLRQKYMMAKTRNNAERMEYHCF